ncbi:MAG: helix-turn-helix domain-containing protein [Bryobacteraceae bacterium]
MRKPKLDVNGNAASPTSAEDYFNFDLAGRTAGELFFEAFAEAIVRRLEPLVGMRQRLMDVHDAAQYLGMTENAIREKASAGDLPYIRIDGRLRFDRREIDRWIDRAPRQGV